MIIHHAIGVQCSGFKADEFREEKLELLKDFCITLTEREMIDFQALNSPREIERFVRTIIDNRWN